MPLLHSFHDVLFPTDIALGAAGGPGRRTEIVTLGSGHEQRNARWANSRRRYNAGYGVKTLDDLSDVIAFFEERRGRLFGFRFRDPVDHKSCKPAGQVSSSDQKIGEGDAINANYQLLKTYGLGEGKWDRKITKPVLGSVAIEVGGTPKIEGVDFDINYLSGEIIFVSQSVPAIGQAVRAGFEFDVPVRFDVDEITINMTHFIAGEITSIPLLEILA